MEASYDNDQDYGSQLADESICSDLTLLGIELDETIESDVDRNYRIALVLMASQSGAELFTNIDKHCPITEGWIGKTLTMNRCVRYSFKGKEKALEILILWIPFNVHQIDVLQILKKHYPLWTNYWRYYKRNRNIKWKSSWLLCIFFMSYHR